MDMTEQEKCRAGLLYDATRPEREAEHLACADICYDFNMTRPSQTGKRTELIRKLFGRVGKNVYVEPTLFCGFGYNIEVGDQFYANNNTVFVDPAKIVFGDNVFIGPHCGFYTAGHPLDAEQRNKGIEFAYPILVGSNVWIGGHSVVLPGIKIGSNVVIGAGSVVTRDIPDNVVAFGNPCRVQRALTEEDCRRYQKVEVSFEF